MSPLVTMCSSFLNTANEQYGFTADLNNAPEQQSVLT
jgi:hypothetical protein